MYVALCVPQGRFAKKLTTYCYCRRHAAQESHSSARNGKIIHEPSARAACPRRAAPAGAAAPGARREG